MNDPIIENLIAELRVVIDTWVPPHISDQERLERIIKSVEINFHKEKETMAFEHKEMSGALFPVSQEKRRSDKSPHYRGNFMLGGTVYDMSAWEKRGARGEWLSIAIRESETAPYNNEKTPIGIAATEPLQPPIPARAPIPTEPKPDDDLPF